MSIQEEVIDHILFVEGEEHTEDPDDSGGSSKWGITEKVARKEGYVHAMKDLPRSVAYAIYADKYWHAINLDSIEIRSKLIVREMADTAVNLGTTRAATFLQECLNAFNNKESYYADIIVDGDIGKATLAAYDAFITKRGKDGEIVLHRALNSLQGAFYIDLSQRRQKDEKYVYGWFLNRVS